MDNQPTNPTPPSETPAPAPATPETPPAQPNPTPEAAPAQPVAAAPTPAPAPFSELPPMGTMQIGTPAGATGDGKGLTPEQLASPPPVTPQNVPTTYGDNHVPAAKRNKTLIIVIAIVAGFFAIAGIVLAIVLINGNKQLSCELNTSSGNISNHVEFNINFAFYRVDNAHIYQKITFPTKVSNLYVEQYRKALEEQDTENDFADLKVYSDGDRSIIAEGTAKVNRLTRRGKTIDEVKELMKDEGYTCKEK